VVFVNKMESLGLEPTAVGQRQVLRQLTQISGRGARVCRYGMRWKTSVPLLEYDQLEFPLVQARLLRLSEGSALHTRWGNACGSGA
jgi:hypothetical protein